MLKYFSSVDLILYHFLRQLSSNFNSSAEPILFFYKGPTVLPSTNLVASRIA